MTRTEVAIVAAITTLVTIGLGIAAKRGMFDPHRTAANSALTGTASDSLTSTATVACTCSCPNTPGATPISCACACPAIVGDAGSADAARPIDAAPTPAWKLPPNASWDITLSVAPNASENVRLLDFDGFDTSATTIQAIHVAGRYAVCYFSAGSAENWRSDYARFQASDLGASLSGWVGENWVNTRSANVRAIMAARADIAKARGCDAIDWDNVDEYSNANGLAITAAEQLDYDRFLAGLAHARGMAVLLKNDLGQIKDLASSFDGAVNESCVNYSECGFLKPFVDAGKPVFSITYGGTTAATKWCSTLRGLGFQPVIKKSALDSYVVQCP